MLFASWEVSLVKNCDEVFKMQFFTIRTDPQPVNNLFIISKLSNEKKKNTRKKAHANFTVTVVRDRKIQTAIRTNQILGFVTVPASKKINCFILS